MKVLQIGKFYPPFHGGIETVIQTLAEGLAQRNHQVDVVCSSHSDRSSFEILNGVSVSRLYSFGKLLSQPLSLGLPFRLRKIYKNYDIIHLHLPNPLAELSILLLPETNCPPIVATYHSDIIRQKKLAFFYRPFLKLLLKRCKAVVVPTNYHIDYSPILPAVRNKCKIIPFGINSTPFDLTHSLQLKISNIKNQFGNFILFVGRLVPYKGLKYLIQAMKGTPSNLIVIGEGPLLASLQTESKLFGVVDQIHFLGAVESTDIAAFYHAAQIIVLPSINRSEAFGMVLLEAMACSKPLITTKIPSGVRFVNQNEETGLEVAAEDPGSLKNGIHRILDDPALKLKMGIAAKKRFETYFKVETMIDSHLSLYENLCRDNA